MNRKLIIRMLGALLLIEAAAMMPALAVSLVYREQDALQILFSILLVLLPGPFSAGKTCLHRPAGRAGCCT